MGVQWRVYTSEEKTKMVEHYIAGAAVDAVAIEAGVSRTKAAEIIREAGVMRCPKAAASNVRGAGEYSAESSTIYLSGYPTKPAWARKYGERAVML